MHISIGNHGLNVSRFLRQERYALYIAEAIRRFVITLISIFLPIYLYTLGYAIRIGKPSESKS